MSRILKFSEAEYSPPDYIVEMEKEERQGDVVLVSGMRTGAAVVKVRIYEPFYKVNSALETAFLSLQVGNRIDTSNSLLSGPIGIILKKPFHTSCGVAPL